MHESLFLALQTGQEAAVNQFDVVMLVRNSGPVVKFVLVLLGFMSAMSWIIIFSKMFILNGAAKQSEKFLNYYQSSSNFGALFGSTRDLKGPSAELFRAGYTELLRIKKIRPKNVFKSDAERESPEAAPIELGVAEQVERVLTKTMSSEVSRLEAYLIFLATTGSTAPFIGLFGTVWGIMTSFIGLASQEGVPTLQAVAPGIAEALIATAVGLAAAIPAVVAYNYLISRVRRIEVDMESFSAEFLNIVDRNF